MAYSRRIPETPAALSFPRILCHANRRIDLAPSLDCLSVGLRFFDIDDRRPPRRRAAVRAGLLSPDLAVALRRLKGAKRLGVRI